MRILVLSVGITVLTSTLLFVYFRNKMTNMDHKVNLVLKTIQDHQQSMARQEYLRQQHMNNMSQQMNEDDEESVPENKEEQFRKEELLNNNVELIEVSDLEKSLTNKMNFDDSDSNGSESESDDSDESFDSISFFVFTFERSFEIKDFSESSDSFSFFAFSFLRA